MWAKRREIALANVPTLPRVGPVLQTPAYTEQQCDSSARAALTLADDEFNFVCSLDYVFVPQLTREDAKALLPWVVARWSSSQNLEGNEDANVLAADGDVCDALSQVEYFVVGTDNGHVFLLPMVPAHFLTLVADRYGQRFPSLAAQLEREGKDSAMCGVTARGAAVPPSCCCCLKRLLHRHICEEPVVALSHCGSIVASAASADTTVAVSRLHPHATPVVLLRHERRVRSLKLWEGNVFTDRGYSHLATESPWNGGNKKSGGCGSDADRILRRRWQEMLSAQEPAAVYLFTGDELDPVVRLFRIDVLLGTSSLLYVFAVSTNLTGVRSPLAVVDRDDASKTTTRRETEGAIYCLAIDNDERLLAGMEGGIGVWALHDLPYRVPSRPVEADPPQTVDPLEHPLCWDSETHSPLVGALLSSRGFMSSALDGLDCGERESVERETEWRRRSEAAAVRRLRRRATRLVNHHVWVREGELLRHALLSPTPSEEVVLKKARSKWKPKYAKAIGGGVAIGVVSNEVAVPLEPSKSPVGEAEEGKAEARSMTMSDVLSSTVVTITFEAGEVKNDVSLPLSCVQPVVYPMCWLRMSGNACFALQVLQHGERVVSSGSEGRVAVWFWEESEERYSPHLISEGGHSGHRGIGRHVCVMRSPDVFLSCGYDDGIVREWHVYDEPERMLRCERRFTMLPAASSSLAGGGANGEPFKELLGLMTGRQKKATDKGQRKSAGSTRERSPRSSRSSSSTSSSTSSSSSGSSGSGKLNGVAGISSAVAFPLFGAVFLVGVFESTIQTFSLVEVQGCEVPPNYLYNGFKTVKVSPPSPDALTEM